MKKTKETRVPIATVHGSYSYGWQQMWKYFLYLFLVSVVIAFAQAPMSSLKDIEKEDINAGLIALQIVGAAYWLLILPVLKFGADFMFLKSIRNQSYKIQEMFHGFRDNYLNIILANLLTVAIVGLGFIFFIVPGIIFACRLAFVSYLVMDKNLEPVAAVEKSWQMTQGYGWSIFWMGMLAIPIVIGGLICLFVGIIFALIWISAAFAAIYYAIDLEEQKLLNEDEEGLTE